MMTHKINHADCVDQNGCHLSEKVLASPEEEKMLTAKRHNGTDHLLDLPEALMEKDVMLLRAELQEIISISGYPETKQETPFDLAENLSLQHIMEDSGYDGLKSSPVRKPLPRIHLHNHRRAMTENLHRFYTEQSEPGSNSSEMDDPVLIEELPFLEDALMETDVMNLRGKLEHICASSSIQSHSAEEIESFLEGEMSLSEMENFEEEMNLDPFLKGDVELYSEVDEALMERDVMEIREKLGLIIQSQHSSSRSLREADAFLEGEMSQDQKTEFEIEMIENRDLRAEMNLLENLEEAILEKDIYSLRDKLKNIAGKLKQEDRKIRSFALMPAKLSKLKRNGTYAAVFFFIVGISSLIWHIREPGETGYDAYFRDPPVLGATRSAGAQMNQDLIRGFEFFSKSEFLPALSSFEKVLQSDRKNQAAQFFAGLTNQKMLRHPEAMSYYNKVIVQPYNMFTQQAEWFRIRSLIAIYGKGSVSSNIEGVIDKKGYYFKDAVALRSRLRKDDR